MRLPALLLVLLLLVAGCATVSPWERGLLADPIMTLEDEMAAGFNEEVEEIREAGGLGGDGDGGGCGCN